MRSTTETLENNQVKLKVEISEDELLPKIEDAFRKVSRQAKLPGFRPGRAPRKVLEAKLGAGFARSEAIQENINKWADRAIVENELEPISAPEIIVIDGDDAGDVTLDVMVEVRPVLNIDGHRSLVIDLPAYSSSEDEIETQLGRLQEALGTLESSVGPIGPGSVVTLDLTIDSYQTGSDPQILSDYVFRIGTDDPYQGLTEALLGKTEGDEFSLVETFVPTADLAHDEGESDTTVSPDVGGSEEASKTISGSIKQHQSLQKPELNDEFAKDASEFETLAELRADMKRNLDNFHESAVRNSWRQVLVDRLGELAGLEKLPENLVRMEFDRLSNHFGNRIESSGLSFAKYLELADTTTEEVSLRIASDAVLETKFDLVLRAVARAENLSSTDEDLKSEVEKIAQLSSMEIGELRTTLETSGQLASLKSELTKRKALDWVFENLTFIDANGINLNRQEITGQNDPAIPNVTEGDLNETATDSQDVVEIEGEIVE